VKAIKTSSPRCTKRGWGIVGKNGEAHQLMGFLLKGIALKNEQAVWGNVTGAKADSSLWVKVLVAGLLGVWVPITLYLLLFAPLPMIHDAIHPVRHAFSFVMCH
jgi:cobalt transporter subunit CbtB